jgi:hypothetical protein
MSLKAQCVTNMKKTVSSESFMITAGSSILKLKQFIKETKVHCDEMMTKLRWM